jgi:7-carboxy-7-deazaguanine synthase
MSEYAAPRVREPLATTYAMAPRPVYWSVQGEGAMSGTPMVFVRLAGCSIGCPLCDTDYRVAFKWGLGEIEDAVKRERNQAAWAWVTGGEPTDRELGPLLAMLRRLGLKVALATAGHRIVPTAVDWLSVSPHDPEAWCQMRGEELKLVPGLNGHRLEAFAAKANSARFACRYVVPCDGDAVSASECLDFLKRNQGWRLGAQAHKQWKLG